MTLYRIRGTSKNGNTWTGTGTFPLTQAQAIAEEMNLVYGRAYGDIYSVEPATAEAPAPSEPVVATGSTE